MLQPDLISGATARNAMADSYVFIMMQTLPRRKASDWRMASSSSMTWTTALSDGIAEILLSHGPQREAKDRPADRIGLHLDLSAVGFDNGAGDRQADAHAVSLVRYEGLEQLRRHFRCDARAGIGDADGDHTVLVGRRRNEEFACWRALHCL